MFKKRSLGIQPRRPEGKGERTELKVDPTKPRALEPHELQKVVGGTTSLPRKGWGN
jgi:hypothetical protein